jgi:hypothetical protein
VELCFGICIARAAAQLDENEFAEARNPADRAARQPLAQQFRIVDEIGFPQANAQNPPARQNRLQAAHYGFNFRQLRHEICRKTRGRKQAYTQLLEIDCADVKK